MVQLDQKYSPIYLPEHNATIFRVPMASATGEFVVPNSEDDGYSVYLADTLTDEEALEKAEHAIFDHIKHHHHGMGADVNKLEAEAHHLAPAPAAPAKKKPKLKKEKNYRRLLRPEEYEKIGIDPKLAPILKLTTIDTPPSRSEKKKYEEMRDNIAETAKRQGRRHY